MNEANAARKSAKYRELTGLSKLSDFEGSLRRDGLGWCQAAEHLVVDQFRHFRLFPAQFAVRVAANLDLTELHRQGIDYQHPAGQRLADAHDQLDRL